MKKTLYEIREYKTPISYSVPLGNKLRTKHRCIKLITRLTIVYEYGSAYLITMQNGYRFIAQHIDKNTINELALAKAKIELISELGD